MGKVVVVTGAGIGLGRALARRFAGDGDAVVLLGRTLAKVEAVAAELGGDALAIGCDVGDPDSVRRAFAAIAERHPAIDVLVNNAAVFHPFALAEATDAQILDGIRINLAGPIYCARAAIPLLGRGGHIVNVSSESVALPFPLLSVYQSTKAGLERLSQSLSQELAPRGIRVSVVRAGSMMEEGKTIDVDPAALMAFVEAAAGVGLSMAQRPFSQYGAVTDVFRALIDLPADVHVGLVAVEARRG